MNEDKGAAPDAVANKVTYVIGVGSGKGGVGKSTSAVLLAQACAAKGLKVGLLDADITGPSVPRLLGIESFRADSDGEKLLPVLTEEGFGVMSINLLVEDEDAPVIWRGPLLSRAVEQFWTDTAWGELDVLVVDLPPGTGDVLITALTALPVTGVAFVATPQDLVSMVVAKAVGMAHAAEAHVLGIVENMGTIVCPGCGKEHPLFAAGEAGKSGAHRRGLPLLGRFPFRPEIAQRGVIRWAELPEGLKAEALAFADAALEAAKKADAVIKTAKANRAASGGEDGKCEGCGCTGDCSDGCSGSSKEAAGGCGCGH
ncbi:MAG TPA: P-loop NTPase [Spirochaetia bacterium]|nr:P-loop NTPase [Spirochaetia bacterium]